MLIILYFGARQPSFLRILRAFFRCQKGLAGCSGREGCMFLAVKCFAAGREYFERAKPVEILAENMDFARFGNFVETFLRAFSRRLRLFVWRNTAVIDTREWLAPAKNTAQAKFENLELALAQHFDFLWILFLWCFR